MPDSSEDLGWLFVLEPERGGLERQIYRQVLAAILDRRLSPGTRLPATRVLAARLGVSRGTVVAAFDQLVAEGYLEARTGRGTAVAALPEELLRAPGESRGETRRIPLPSTRAADFARARTRGGLEPRCFQAGMPSIDDFPRKEWARCLAARARTIRAVDMTYENGAGLPVLREAIAAYLNRARGVVAHPDQVVVIPSSQAGFAIVALCVDRPRRRDRHGGPRLPQCPHAVRRRRGEGRAGAGGRGGDRRRGARRCVRLPPRRGHAVTPVPHRRHHEPRAAAPPPRPRLRARRLRARGRL